MPDRLEQARWPSSLRDHARLLQLGPAPAVIVTPDEAPPPWPLVLWLHGRSVNKEIDSARYRRLQRGGIATCAIDLPGHGERLDEALQQPEALADLLGQALTEVDPVLEAALAADARLDADRLAIGGVSAGGMVTLRRLGDPHRFLAAAVESSGGDLAAAGSPARYREVGARGLDPIAHLAGWRPIPLLALHSEADALVPVAAIRGFTTALAAHYAAQGADADLVRLVTWETTGAPQEHLGLGKRSAEGRQLLLDHLQRALRIEPTG